MDAEKFQSFIARNADYLPVVDNYIATRATYYANQPEMPMREYQLAALAIVAIINALD